MFPFQNYYEHVSANSNETIEGFFMSIKSFIEASKELYKAGYYEEALCLVCNAIDACASQVYPDKGVNERYKQFLKDHFREITEVGFPGISANSIRIKVNAEIDQLRLDSNGYADMEQIIYHVVRCGLVHDCAIDQSVVFIDRTIIGDWDDGRFYLPRAIIFGLIAVVESFHQIQ